MQISHDFIATKIALLIIIAFHSQSETKSIFISFKGSLKISSTKKNK